MGIVTVSNNIPCTFSTGFCGRFVSEASDRLVGETKVRKLKSRLNKLWLGSLLYIVLEGAGIAHSPSQGVGNEDTRDFYSERRCR